MATNHIKGLTVEIGGDTTKLGKALEGVNQKSRELSSELGEINKLLKLDPGNTELLAQKQKVLASAIANTADKLETLKAAEKQVQKQFERGEVSEEQVRALQREIIQTEKKMESYQRAARETANETEKVGKSADEAGDKAGRFGNSVKTAGAVAVKSLAAVAAAAAAAVSALVAAAESSREYRREMGKLDTAFTTAGHSSETATATYKELQGILGETDQAVEAANHLAKLADSQEDLKKWTEICTGVYATFGASLPIEGLTEAANETAKVGKVTGPLADALNWAGVNEDQFNESLAACTDEQERQALITETLNDLYKDAAKAYKKTNAEVIRANKANEEWADVMADVGASVEPVLSDIKLLGASLLKDLLPGIEKVTGAFRDLLNGVDGAGEALGTAVGDMLNNVVAKISELLPVIAEVGVSIITTLVESIITELPTLVEAVIQAVMTIIDGITEAIPGIVDAFVEAIPKIVAALVEGIPQLIEGVTQLIMALVEAFPQIITPLIEALPQIVMAIVQGLRDNLPTLIDGAVEFFLAILEAIPVLIEELLTALPAIIEAILGTMAENLPRIIEGSTEMLFGILEAIPEIVEALFRTAPSIVWSLIKGLLQAIPALFEAGGQLMSGLFEGMLDFDILGAIGGIVDSIIDGFTSLFGIHSPSRVMMGLGEMLDEGLAVGVEDNADAPVDAIGQLSDDMLGGAEEMNGLTLERRVSHTFTPNTAEDPTSSVSAKLDQIYNAIRSGQVIMLDGKVLVGSTADRYDTELGQRRILAERGAI